MILQRVYGITKNSISHWNFSFKLRHIDRKWMSAVQTLHNFITFEQSFYAVVKKFSFNITPKVIFLKFFYLIWNDLYRELYLYIICSSRDNFTEWSFCGMGHFDSSIQRRWVIFSRWKLARAQQTCSFWEIRRQMNVHWALNKFDDLEHYVLTVMCGPERSHVQWCVSLF